MNEIKKIKTPILLFVSSFIIFSLFGWERVLKPSPHFHFLDLANSFLSLRLDTDTPKRFKGMRKREDEPKGLQDAVDRHLSAGGWNDWASYHIIKLKNGEEVRGVYPWSNSQTDEKYKFLTFNNEIMIINSATDIARNCGKSARELCDEIKYFVSFPPFPAILFIPLFFISGYNINDVLFTIFFASLNSILIFILLQNLSIRGLSGRSENENIILTILFSFGTLNFFSAIRGEVWFTALIIGITLNLLYLIFVINKRPFLAGLFLSFSFATRTPLFFASIFFLMETLFEKGWKINKNEWKKVLKKLTLFAIPAVSVGIALMIFNYLRFENPFEFGHSYLMGGARASIRDHGLFSPWFLKYNLPAAFTNVPVITPTDPPFIHITRHGLSFIFCTPVFLLILWPLKKSPLYFKLLITSFIVALPSLFYQNTGWAQFGYRFSLDWTPYLILLLAIGERKMTKGFKILFILSIIFNSFGAITYDRIPMFYYD